MLAVVAADLLAAVPHQDLGLVRHISYATSEREAASLIAQGQFAPDSTVSIVGFASEDGPGQSPVDVVCPPTVVRTAQHRQFLSSCVGKLKRQAEKVGI